MISIYGDLEYIDGLYNNKNFLNNQNYIITKKIKKKIITNFISIKTKVNGHDIIKYKTIGKYRIIDFSNLESENIINNFIFMIIPIFLLLLGILGNDIDIFGRFLLIGFSIIFIFLFLKIDNSNLYLIVRDRKKVYILNKN